MGFDVLLNTLIDQTGCTAKELSQASGVSEAAISRYRSGERTPAPGSDHMQGLASGLAALSRSLPADQQLDETGLLYEFETSVSGIEVPYEAYIKNLNALLGALGVSNSALARALAFDPSYISRVLSGQRRPSDIPDFTRRVAQFVAMRHGDGEDLARVASLIEADPDELTDRSSCANRVALWLTRNPHPAEGAVDRFLRKLDEFDLDEYIRAIKFDQLKVPTAPFQMPTTKVYEGLGQFKEAEIDFLKAAVLSRSTEPVTMYSDMPLTQMSEDTDFAKKWMLGMAMLLKKGLRLNMVHDVNRPLPEMMLGLESWIPMYMTGQIAPYYLKTGQGAVFNHLLKVSGTAAMTGEAVAGAHAHGRYTVTKAKADVAYQRQRAADLLKHAHPLMRIFTEQNAQEFERFMDESSLASSPIRSVLTSPPLYTIGGELLARILERSGASPADCELITGFAHSQRALIEEGLEQNDLLIELPDLDVDEFAEHPASLSLSTLMRAGDLLYAYDEYREHVEQTVAFAEEHARCTVRLTPSTVFRNIQIHLLGDERVLVSKGRSPVIHFVIEHPNMVAAFRDFVPPLDETGD